MLNMNRLGILCGAFLVFSGVLVCGDGARWEVEPFDAQALFPRLDGGFNLAGNGDQWGQAVSVPFRFPSYIAHRHPDAGWAGERDLGAEFFLGWTGDGLWVGVIVADDVVHNDRPPQDYWQQDAVELYLDGRVGDRFMQSPYSAGAYQIFIRPPHADHPVDVAVNPRDGDIEGLKASGHATPEGYVVEVFVPWNAFPDFVPAPGARIGLQMGLCDYDPPDGDIEHPLLMTWRAATHLFSTPEHMIAWELVDEMPVGAGIPLDVSAAIDVPNQLLEEIEKQPVTIDIGRNLAPGVEAAVLTIKDWGQNAVLEKEVPLEPVTGMWTGAKRGVVIWDHASLPDGAYTLHLELMDAESRPVGIAARPVLLAERSYGRAHRVLPAAIEALAAMDLVALAAEAPLRVRDVMGAAATVERLKRGMAIESVPVVAGALFELDARLALLNNETIPSDAHPLAQLLTLTAVPHSQVVVEYPWRDVRAWQTTANVSFHLGPIPLASVAVHQLDEEWEGEPDTDIRVQPREGRQFGTFARRLPRRGGVLAEYIQGPLRFECQAPNETIARIAIRLASSGAPITPAQMNELHNAVMDALPRPAIKPDAFDDSSLAFFGGDLHMHTFYSDGVPSPLGLMFQSVYAGMDFAVITDHNTIRGGQDVQELMRAHGFNHVAVVGEEITTWEHFNAFPLTELIDWRGRTEEIVAAAHAQNAVIYWCHPPWTASDPWTAYHMEHGLAGTGLHAWEHRPPAYEKWKAEGRLPTVVSGSDSHCGTFARPGRTLIMAPGFSGPEVAEAVKQGRAIMWSALDPDLLVGADTMIAAMTRVLQDPEAIMNRQADTIRGTVANLDLGALLREGPARRP